MTTDRSRLPAEWAAKLDQIEAELATAETGLANSPLRSGSHNMTTDRLNEIAIRLGKAEIELAAAKRAEAQARRSLARFLIVIIVLSALLLVAFVVLVLP